MVEVPSILVDYIVVDPKQRQRAESPDYNPGICGEIRLPEPPIIPLPLDAEKVISRRGLMELNADMVVNIGGGLPSRSFPLVAREENVAPHVHISVEHGSLGGVNLGGRAHLNPTCLLTSADIMDLYHGGGLDWSFLGFMEVDKLGNVNLGRLGKITEGPGGCIDIASSTNKVAFVGTFTYAGLKVEIGDGKLRIITEGKIKKFVNKVQGIFYNSEYGKPQHQKIVYITERAVFELRDEGVTLTEVAPGIDIERDILDQMEFKPIMAKDIREMSSEIFMTPTIGIGDRFE
jgi:propionate CoA-transferase